MKKIPEIRFPEFSGEWVEKKLGEICKFFSGGTPKTTNKEYWNGNIPFIKSGEISSKKTTSFITEKGLKNSSAKLVKKGDLLFALYGATSGEVAISKINGAINQAILCIRCKNLHMLVLYYLFLKNKNKLIYRYTQGGQPNLSAKIVKSLSLLFPPTLAEQQKIAKFLSKIDEKIEIVTKKIDELKQYKKGLLQKMLNVTDKDEPELRFKEFSGKWVEKRLGEISICEDNKRIPLNEKERKNKKGSYPYWGSTKIMDYVNDYIFDGEYILLSEDGGYFYDYKDKPIAFYVNGKFWANNHIHVLKIVDNHSKFIYYSLVHKNILPYIIGGTRTKLNQRDLKLIKIHIPPTIEEQQKIANFLSSIDEKIELNENKLKALKKYKQGLLQKIFV